eukprot:TRINITY_DN2906_c0_g1_i2.p2 TRINITY_DN2906_c0_g1~~TRINITY_DN2906_c0_g1_i2.p2  ORF type:complete len:138 (-),score=44.90 TRINITY_DN2906_c0_g1_i2:118-531(-)
MCMEYWATMDTLKQWEQLSPLLFGNVINLDGKAVAFCVGERIGEDTAVCHFEKSDFDLTGISQLINKWFAERVLQGTYKYVNREEDCGSPGLRQAKQGYNPCMMVQKYNAWLGGAPPQQTCAFKSKCSEAISSDLDW